MGAYSIAETRGFFMALDTRDKRASAIGTFSPVPSILPNPDNDVSIVDKYQVAYSYPFSIVTDNELVLGARDISLTLQNRDTGLTACARDGSLTLQDRDADLTAHARDISLTVQGDS